ncbi:hypothetical protein R1flu_015804 [Riccia fluitans]|uniref:Uncharacterized protein n=1 Tax=Riccia fluitans TaxID=41844 RepID=A0ABD1YKI2_9MARC
MRSIVLRIEGSALFMHQYVDRASRTLKARKFRRRADEVEEDAEESEKSTIKAPTDKLSKEKEKAKSKPPTKTTGPLLSFAEDEEYAGDRETKGSSSSGRSASKKEKSKPRPGSKSGHGSSQRFGFGRDKSAAGLSLPSNMQAQVGEYTKEKLAELQRNTVRLGAPDPPPGDNKPTEPVIVLKGLLKPPGAAENANVTDSSEGNFFGDALDSNERIDRLRDVDGRDRLRRDQDDAESRLGLMGIGSRAESGGITHIPDAAAIAAAKAMRERARQAQSAPDYIS